MCIYTIIPLRSPKLLHLERNGKLQSLDICGFFISGFREAENDTKSSKTLSFITSLRSTRALYGSHMGTDPKALFTSCLMTIISKHKKQPPIDFHNKMNTESPPLSTFLHLK